MKRTLRVLTELETTVNALKPEIARVFAAKEARRRELAALPFPEKVRAVVRLQEMVAPLLRARGKHVTVWPADESTPISR